MNPIDREIAERLGWQAYELDCNERKGWNFRKPNGKTQNWCAPSEEYLWQACLPNWNLNIEAGLELCAELGIRITLEYWPEGKMWLARDEDKRTFRMGFQYKQPAEAVARVILAWLKTRKETKP